MTYLLFGCFLSHNIKNFEQKKKTEFSVGSTFLGTGYWSQYDTLIIKIKYSILITSIRALMLVWDHVLFKSLRRNTPKLGIHDSREFEPQPQRGIFKVVFNLNFEYIVT